MNRATLNRGRAGSAALLQTLTDLARATSEARSQAHLASLVIQYVCHVFDGASAALYLWDGLGEQLRLASSSPEGAEALDPHVAPAESLAARVFAEQQPALIEDYAAWRKATRSFEPAGFGAAAAVPLSAGQRALGALVVRFPSRTSDADVLDVLSLVGMIASSPLETAALRERLRAGQLQRDGARRRGAIADLAAWTLTGADLDELLQASINTAAVAVEAELATLHELEPSRDRFTLRAVAGGTYEVVVPITDATGAASQAGYTLFHGEPVLVEDLASEQRFVPDQHLLSQEISSSLSVVVPGRTQVFGVLGLHSRRRRAFSESSAGFARTFASVLGLAILYRRSEEALYRRGQEVSALVDHIPDVVVRVNSDLKVTFANSPIEWATGRPATSFVGLGIETLGVPDAMLHLVQLRFKHVFRTGRVQAFDLPLIGPAGQHDYETYLIPELARDGSVAAVLAVARDVTERRRIESEREEQQRQLLAHEQRLEDLLAQMIVGQANEQRRRAEIAKLEPLSSRETQVLRLLAEGRTNSQIALELLVSPGTVKNHISRILPKLSAVDRTQAAARAVELGLLGS